MAVDVDSQYNKNNPFLAKLTENRLLNKPGTIKDTRHFVVELDGSDLFYACGDSLAVYPTNRSEEVDALLLALGATGDEATELPRLESQITFREALSNKLSLATPTRKTLIKFAEKASANDDQIRLDELLEDSNKESTAIYLENREHIDLLEEFPSVRFTPQEFVSGLRRLVPRLYSIASSPSQYPNEVHLTVAIVRYQTNNRDRVGVCSTYLADRVPLGESSVPVFVAKSHFGLPEDSSVPIIMVGPGTGIAPFRAFLQERITTGATGKNWLFFGDQHHATDYLYGEEFGAMKEAGQLHRIGLAWSRDQENKIYVQDKMMEAGAEIWDWVNDGAHLYVCGDATRMAKDVDEAIHHIIHKFGAISEDEAEGYVKQMKKEKRYQRDVY
ncbi:MAG: sulfite reductase subunit alpha [Opitutaceae bacterium]|nr:sulfite reductase subunit alpha [Opitutaceae bacterium]|tara:strand:- start:3638 stop:4798 length:1161 start_codon:yes stop_codon:yes gene_type:complete